MKFNRIHKSKINAVIKQTQKQIYQHLNMPLSNCSCGVLIVIFYIIFKINLCYKNKPYSLLYHLSFLQQLGHSKFKKKKTVNSMTLSYFFLIFHFVSLHVLLLSRNDQGSPSIFQLCPYSIVHEISTFSQINNMMFFCFPFITR